MPHAETEQDRPVYGNFPPAVYEALLGTGAAIVVICWLFFAEDFASAVPTAAITVFTVISLGLPFGLWAIAGDKLHSERLRTWMNGRLEIWQTWLKGRDAVLLALLPPCSIVVGLAVMSLIAQLAADRAI